MIMTNNTYLETCRQLLKAFETTQYLMLRMELKLAEEEFLIEMQEMRLTFNQMGRIIQKKSFSVKRDQILLKKQIERLEKFLSEMKGHIQGFSRRPAPDEKKIIFIFNRQHLFKNIYRKHLSDFVNLL